MSNSQLSFEAQLLPLEFLTPAEASQFNVRMLTLAREARGLTQRGLADVIHYKQGRISKIEAGVLVPDKADIQNFELALGQKKEFFFQKGETSPASNSYFRKAQSMSLTMLRQCNARMNIRRLEIERTIGDKKLGNRELPYLPPETNGGARAVAQGVRKKWDIKRGPVQHLTRLVEETGCVIVDFAFPSPKLDALCIHAPQKPRFIFLNKDFPKSRRRLTLAHELGHLVMHTNPHEKIEDEAWEFAQEFLMPTAEIGKELDGLNFDKLGQLKQKWGVSMQAILFHAQKMGKISESYSRYLWVQIGKRGWRVNEPYEDLIPDEQPTELENRLKTYI